MSTNAFANARELKDIAALLESIQRIADRVSTRNLSVTMGSIAIYNSEGVVVGYAEQESGVYAFKTVSEHIEQREDDPVLETATGTLSIVTPDMMGQHDTIESKDLPADEPVAMEQTVPMSEAREMRASNGSHAAHV
jgi:hypothetical protein